MNVRTASLLVVFAVLEVLALRGTPIWMADFAVYEAAGHAVREGVSLYDLSVESDVFDPMSFTYPPFAALLFLPLALHSAEVFWFVATIFALAAVVWLALGEVPKPWRVLAVTCGASLLTPVLATTTLGQINVFLMLAIMLDVTGRIPARWQGIPSGIAAGIKLWPVLVVGYFVCIGRFRAAATVVAAFLATAVVGFVVLPDDSWRYWIDGAAVHTSRVTNLGDVQNQSLVGVVARATGSESALWWLPVAAVVAGVGLWAARIAHRRNDDLLAAVWIGVAAVLASPVSWPHHAVWVAPGLVWLWTARWSSEGKWAKVIRVAATIWCFVPTFVIAVPEAWRDQALTVPQQLVVAATGYTIVLTAALATFPVWRRRLAPIDQAN